jgi:hypothetical protein
MTDENWQRLRNNPSVPAQKGEAALPSKEEVSVDDALFDAYMKQ